MLRLLLSGWVSVAPSAALAQVKKSDIYEHCAVTCIESPTPGKRPPSADCAILLQRKFSSMPPGPLVWGFENFSRLKAAQGASTPASVVVEAARKVWLLALPSALRRTFPFGRPRVCLSRCAPASLCSVERGADLPMGRAPDSLTWPCLVFRSRTQSGFRSAAAAFHRSSSLRLQA